MTIRSMTGYGQASVDLGTTRVTVELRSLNHRFADIRIRLPAQLVATEREIRSKLLARIERGRLELNVNVAPAEGSASRPMLNRELLEEALSAASSLSEEFDVRGAADLPTLLSLPGMFRPASPDLQWNDEEREALSRAIDQALEVLEQDRLREGRHLQQDLKERLLGMTRIVENLRGYAVRVPAKVRDRLLERLGALAGDLQLDPGRVAQEALLLADRADVTEELVRLGAHLTQATQLIEGAEGKPVGKRLDFLLQEIHRETNTISSKSTDLELSREALSMKGEIEKVREQVQNLE